jgi:hypothetical protein
MDWGKLMNESDLVFVYPYEGSKAKERRREQEEEREQLAKYMSGTGEH